MSFLYNKAKQKILEGGILLLSDSIRAVLVDSAQYTANADHEFLSSVPSGSRVAISDPLLGKTVTNGTFNSQPAFVSSVPSGRNVGAIVLYKDTGNDATSPVILYLDAGSNLPFATSGAAISVSWSTGPAKIFSLMTFGGPNWRVNSYGEYQIQNSDFPGRWHTITIRGDNGSETISIGAGSS